MMQSRAILGCNYKADLESELRIEVDQLRKDTEQLFYVAGKRKHEEFSALKKRCDADHNSIAEIRREIAVHCTQHGC